jgi:hypothetical protein
MFKTASINLARDAGNSTKEPFHAALYSSEGL